MTKLRYGGGLLLIGALLPQQGCSSSLNETQTAAEVRVEPFVLLDAGQEPRTELRYAVEEGTTTTSTMSFRTKTTGDATVPSPITGLQSIELKLISGPAQVSDDRVRYDMKVVRAKAIPVRGASKQLADDVKKAAGFLKDAATIVETGLRGDLLGSQANQIAARVPTRILWALINTRVTLSQVLLPVEPVGLGARWQTHSMLSIHGFKLEQTVTYTFVGRDDDQVILNMDFKQVGNPQTVEFPSEGASIQVTSAETTARGQVLLDLKALASNATAAGRVKDELIIMTGEDRETATVNELFEIRIDSETSKARPQKRK